MNPLVRVSLQVTANAIRCTSATRQACRGWEQKRVRSTPQGAARPLSAPVRDLLEGAIGG
jgi:hypothetical protein